MNLINSKNWILEFSKNLNSFNLNEDLKIVICPNYVQLSEFTKNFSAKIKLSIGAQNVSEKNSGAFTGEVSAEHLSEISKIDYCIIGHSERR
jgi:triosephosphate isomerase